MRTPKPAPNPRTPLIPHSKLRFVAALHIGQIACWQVAFALIGLTVGKPLPLAVPAGTFAATLLALTALRLRNRWLYEWTWRYVRFRIRPRGRYLSPDDGARAVLHLFAPDAAMASIQLNDVAVAVVSRTRGATAVLEPVLAEDDPVDILPRPEAILPFHEETSALGVQVVFHGVAGNRSRSRAWIAIQAIRTPELCEEDEIMVALDHAVQRMLRPLSKHAISSVALDQTKLLDTFASLAHIRGGRGDVLEQWRYWCCGPVAQASFRLGGWAALPDVSYRRLLRRLLTEIRPAVVTVAVSAGAVGGKSGPETAIVRVAASSVEDLEQSVKVLDRLATERDIRLDRMDGEHAEGVAATLPLGVLR